MIIIELLDRFSTRSKLFLRFRNKIEPARRKKFLSRTKSSPVSLIGSGEEKGCAGRGSRAKALSFANLKIFSITDIDGPIAGAAVHSRQIYRAPENITSRTSCVRKPPPPPPPPPPAPRISRPIIDIGQIPEF